MAALFALLCLTSCTTMERTPVIGGMIAAHNRETATDRLWLADHFIIPEYVMWGCTMAPAERNSSRGVPADSTVIHDHCEYLAAEIRSLGAVPPDVAVWRTEVEIRTSQRPR
ncbi:MAG: hypothetical protein OXB97_04585 [Rhodospirillales bacterium]|nr:hypothetical protein [Rhodospirillales bacterium]